MGSRICHGDVWVSYIGSFVSHHVTIGLRGMSNDFTCLFYGKGVCIGNGLSP